MLQSANEKPHDHGRLADAAGPKHVFARNEHGLGRIRAARKPNTPKIARRPCHGIRRKGDRETRPRAQVEGRRRPLGGSCPNDAATFTGRIGFWDEAH